MRFAFTDEQRELRSTVRTLLGRHGSPPVGPPDAPASGHEHALWRRLAGQIGTHGLAVPEEYGGSGFGLLETSIVVGELGRALVNIPFLGSAVLGAQALLRTADTTTCLRLLPGIAAGENIIALAWAEPGRGWEVADCSTTARRSDDGWLLDGIKEFVLDGAQADTVLVVARSPAGLTLDRIFGELAELPIKDEVWPRFIRHNAMKVLGIPGE